MLEALITSKARLAILRLFFENEGEKLYLREISRRLSINANQVKRELDRLSKAGLFVKSQAGRTTLYSLDRKFAFYGEIRSMLRKSPDIKNLLAKSIDGMIGISFAFIFGSFAEGKDTPKSDIDLMVIGKPDMDELNRRISRMEKAINRPIQYIVYPKEEFERKRRYGFVKNVMEKKKIFIKGNTNELGRA
ncbi:MAG: nucleotidyltransferase domain-containing protein [Candidatus Micrarchaeota archaeon]